MNDKFKNKKHTISFKNAVSGIKIAFLTQPNLKVMLFFAFTSYLLCYILKVTYLEWIVITLTIFMVFFAEMVNTSIESMVDLITTEWHEDAKIAKDISSGMVLTAVIGSVIVGFLIFLPRIISLLRI